MKYLATALSLALLLTLGLTDSLGAQDSPASVRVFILAGQSNMQGHAVVDMDHKEDYNGGKGNLNDLLENGGGRFAYLKEGESWTVREDVFVRFVTNDEVKTGGLSIGFAGYEDRKHFGPELQFGHVIGNHFDEPVLLIKTAWGGKSLKTDFRPPSAVEKRGGQVGPYYMKMIEEVRTGLANAVSDFPKLKDASFQISGFVWQQGWNDMVDEESRKEYFQNLTDLIQDVRTEWQQPNLPVVVGELGNGGKEVNENLKLFRNQQSRIDAHPPFVGNVRFAPTRQHARSADDSPKTTHLHHWFGNAESYLMVGDSLGKQMVRLYQRPSSPRVLILGDSISIGYTSIVKQGLRNEAFVVRPMRNHRAAENCAGTDNGIKNIDRWISNGGGNWDVIHFNFGLHDLKHVNPETLKNSNDPEHPQQTPPEAYETQLREIVEKLKATGATLIFSTTTPYPEGVKPFRHPESPEIYNAIARKVMAEHDGILINDLYAVTVNRLDELQRPKNVHFKSAGSEILGQEVTKQIRDAIAKLAKRAK